MGIRLGQEVCGSSKPAERHKPNTSLSTSLLLILPLVAALELNLPLICKGQLCRYPTPVYEEVLSLPTESTSADCVDQKTVQVALHSHPTWPLSMFLKCNLRQCFSELCFHDSHVSATPLQRGPRALGCCLTMSLCVSFEILCFAWRQPLSCSSLWWPMNHLKLFLCARNDFPLRY